MTDSISIDQNPTEQHTLSSLYLVPTPIGNLQDITLRSLAVLKEVDLILAEDTRNTIHLLRHFKIEKPLRSYHAHNEHATVEQIVEMIESNKSVALAPFR